MCVCACVCVYPGQLGLEPQSVEAVISNHLVIVFLDIIIKSIKLKLCLNSLLQKWRHVNCIWLCLQSSSISSREIPVKDKYSVLFGDIRLNQWMQSQKILGWREMACNSGWSWSLHKIIRNSRQFLTFCQLEKLHWSSLSRRWGLFAVMLVQCFVSFDIQVSPLSSAKQLLKPSYTSASLIWKSII